MLVRADRTGLGNQTYNYWKFLKPHKTLIIDIGELNGNKSDYEKYPCAEFCKGIPSNDFIDLWLRDIDLVFTVETPYNYYLFEKAKQRGIKSVMQYNWEFLDYLQTPNLPKPDLLIAPSLWHIDDMDNTDLNFKYLPVPIDRQKLPYKKRGQAKTFLHIAGKKTFMDRNGTDLFLAAIPFVKSDVKFIVRTQQELCNISDKRVSIDTLEKENYWELYQGEDVLVMPRKYGGLCLPLNEAMSTGMIPLMTDCEPQSLFLKEESLVEPFTVTDIQTRTTIQCYETTPNRLAAKIDEMANLPKDKIEELSEHSNTVATMWSWDLLYDKYMETFNEVCNTPSK